MPYFKNIKSFIKSKRLTIKSIYFISILLLVFISAIILINTTPSQNMSCTNTINTSSSIKSLRTFKSSDDKEAETASLSNYFNEVFKTRNSSILSGNVENLYKYFTKETSDGRYTLHHELKRIAYIRDWAKERNITFTNITSYPNVRYINGGPDTFSSRVDEEYKFEYIYNDEPEITNEFGISLFHTLNIKKNNDSYIITKDYYLDAFEDGFKAYNFNLDEKEIPLTKENTYEINFQREDICPCECKKLNREGCKNYADKYCGVVWASGNESKYNKSYINYTGSGGNCTNYVSQCLGDTEGGSIPTDYTWYFLKSKQEGSVAWLNAAGFKDYILYSGKGKIIKKSDFAKSLLPLEDGSHVFNNLYIGDIVSYASDNAVIHNAIITGFDSKGYPLINSHTVDRYRVPFDLGWGDNNISFYFIHIII